MKSLCSNSSSRVRAFVSTEVQGEFPLAEFIDKLWVPTECWAPHLLWRGAIKYMARSPPASSPKEVEGVTTQHSHSKDNGQKSH